MRYNVCVVVCDFVSKQMKLTDCDGSPTSEMTVLSTNDYNDATKEMHWQKKATEMSVDNPRKNLLPEHIFLYDDEADVSDSESGVILCEFFPRERHESFHRQQVSV